MPCSRKIVNSTLPISISSVGTQGLGQIYNESEGDTIFWAVDVSQITGGLPSDPTAAVLLTVGQGSRFLPMLTVQQQIQNVNQLFDLAQVYAMTIPSFAAAVGATITASKSTLVCDEDVSYYCWLRGSFVVPAIGDTVSVTFDTTAAITTALAGENTDIFIDTAGWFEIVTVDSGTSATLRWTGDAGAPVTCFCS